MNRTTAAAGTSRLAWAVLGAALLEVLAPLVNALGPGASPGEGAGATLAITPAGWAFAIWGVIYTLAVLQAVGTLAAGPGRVPRRLQVDLVVLYLGGAVWILLAALSSSLATAVALLVMAVAAVDAVLLVTRRRTGPTWLTLLTRAGVGLYAGWVTAALFLNVSTALVELDVVAVADLGWQLLVLLVAVATLAAVTLAARATLAYPLAGCWALVGIAATGLEEQSTAVAVTALSALVVLVALTLVLRGTRRLAPA